MNADYLLTFAAIFIALVGLHIMVHQDPSNLLGDLLAAIGLTFLLVYWKRKKE